MMGSVELWGHIAACPYVLFVAGAVVAGCGNSLAYCPEKPGDASSDDASDTGPGMVQVVGTFTNTTCPEINPVGISPDSSGLVNLTATIAGSAPDGSVLTYTWTTPLGSFIDAHTLDTSFRCPGAGTITVTLTATAGQCQNAVIALVMCQMVYSGTL
jgi:hypothetical protein